jgi:hypothetical protein
VGDFLQAFAVAWAQFAPWLLLGFLLAGVLHARVPSRWLGQALGGTGWRPILRGALIGLPLPLCSCSVIPVAVELRRRGAARGATASFLISTPEIGVDSILTSFAVLHPVLAVARPLAAIVTAAVTGLMVERWSRPPAAMAAQDAACACPPSASAERGALGLAGGLRYAFVDLFAEVARFLLPVFLLTALLTTWIEPSSLQGLVGSQWLQMLLMLAVSVPIYVCASAATPLAAALIGAGLSPGAALVFLLAGPATNLTTILVAVRILGGRGALVYVLAVAGVSLLAGVLLDLVFERLDAGPAAVFHDHSHLAWWHWVGGAVLLALVLAHLTGLMHRKPAR